MSDRYDEIAERVVKAGILSTDAGISYPGAAILRESFPEPALSRGAEEREPGELIAKGDCPCCGAPLEVMVGDDDGETAVIGVDKTGMARETIWDEQPAAPAPIVVHCEGKHPYGIDPEASEEDETKALVGAKARAYAYHSYMVGDAETMEPAPAEQGLVDPCEKCSIRAKCQYKSDPSNKCVPYARGPAQAAPSEEDESIKAWIEKAAKTIREIGDDEEDSGCEEEANVYFLQADGAIGVLRQFAALCSRLNRQGPALDDLLAQEVYSLREKLKIAVEAIKADHPDFDEREFTHRLNSADFDQLMEELSGEDP